MQLVAGTGDLSDAGVIFVRGEHQSDMRHVFVFVLVSAAVSKNRRSVSQQAPNNDCQGSGSYKR